MLMERSSAQLGLFDATAQIPLKRRDGSIAARVLIDADLLPELDVYRWHLNNSGYAVRGEWRNETVRGILMHRQILGLSIGDGRESDHINRNKLDNRRENLRVCTRAENNQNKASRPNTSSPYRGVYFADWKRGRLKWRARVILNGTLHHLGYFATEIEAASAVEDFRATHTPHVFPDAPFA